MKITKTTRSNNRRILVLRNENIRFNKGFLSFISQGLCGINTLQITLINSSDHRVFLSKQGVYLSNLSLMGFSQKGGNLVNFKN